MITAFVRAGSPAGSPAAYTADELDLLNGDRASRFDPYAPEVDVP